MAPAIAAAALATVVGFGSVDAAYADIAGLTPCASLLTAVLLLLTRVWIGIAAGARSIVVSLRRSKAYDKRLKNELKDLGRRLKKVRR